MYVVCFESIFIASLGYSNSCMHCLLLCATVAAFISKGKELSLSDLMLYVKWSAYLKTFPVYRAYAFFSSSEI